MIEIFKILEKRRVENYQIVSALEKYFKNKSSTIAKHSYLINQPKESTFKILKQEIKKNGLNNNYHKSLALEFIADYVNQSEIYAEDFIKIAKDLEPDSKQYKSNLNSAMKLTLKAMGALTLGARIDSSSEELFSEKRGYLERMIELNEQRKDIPIIVDSPYTYEEIIKRKNTIMKLKYQLKKAIKKQEYESAAILRDELKDLEL